MKEKQSLTSGYQEIEGLKIQVSTLKGKNTNQANLISQLTNALESLKRQYEDMLKTSDATIAEQAEHIKMLANENKELRRQLEELKKNVA